VQFKREQFSDDNYMSPLELPLERECTLERVTVNVEFLMKTRVFCCRKWIPDSSRPNFSHQGACGVVRYDA
jgi:hypothetical protein